jgi:hypothetical protein
VPFFTPGLLGEWIARRLNGEHLATLQAFRRSLPRTGG